MKFWRAYLAQSLFSSEHHFVGCFKGLTIGDAYGAGYEGGIIERSLWRLFGHTKHGEKRFTDDTQMSMDVAVSLLENNALNQDHLAQEFAKHYTWSRGYGPATASLLKGIKQGKNWQDINCEKYKEGSMGNGAAMRSPIIALWCHSSPGSTKEFVRKASEITHAHPLAIEGAEIIANTTQFALHGMPNTEILKSIASNCESEIFKNKLNKCMEFLGKQDIPIQNIKRSLGNGILATESCMTAVYFGLKYRGLKFEAMLDEIFSLGGDADTIGAMAGAIWGASNGNETIDYLGESVEGIDLIEKLAKQLWNNHLTQRQQ